MIYQQWVYPNLVIHFKIRDLLTVPEHHEILNRIESYSLVDPDILLPRHWFLFEADFQALGCVPTSHRCLWLADMETAVAASNLARAGTLTSLVIAHFSQATATRVVPSHAMILGTMSEVRNPPDLVGQVQLPSKGCYDIHNSVDMLLCCGCSCLWPEKKDKRYVCSSQSWIW